MVCHVMRHEFKKLLANKSYTGDRMKEQQALRIPECVSNPIFEVDKVSVVLEHQVSSVEIHITLFKDVSQQLLFRHGLISRVTKKRVGERQWGNQQAYFT